MAPRRGAARVNHGCWAGGQPALHSGGRWAAETLWQPPPSRGLSHAPSLSLGLLYLYVSGGSELLNFNRFLGLDYLVKLFYYSIEYMLSF